MSEETLYAVGLLVRKNPRTTGPETGMCSDGLGQRVGVRCRSIHRHESDKNRGIAARLCDTATAMGVGSRVCCKDLESIEDTCGSYGISNLPMFAFWAPKAISTPLGGFQTRPSTAKQKNALPAMVFTVFDANKGCVKTGVLEVCGNGHTVVGTRG